ncbi:MAG: putative hydroxylase, partial [uncultured Friedmanniella sp.]
EHPHLALAPRHPLLGRRVRHRRPRQRRLLHRRPRLGGPRARRAVGRLRHRRGRRPDGRRHRAAAGRRSGGLDPLPRHRRRRGTDRAGGRARRDRPRARHGRRPARPDGGPGRPLGRALRVWQAGTM